MRRLEALGIALALVSFAAAIWGLGAIAGGAGAVVAGVMAICWQAGRWQALPLLLAGLCVLMTALWPPSANALLVVAGLAGAIGAALLGLMPIPRLPGPCGPHRVGLRIERIEGKRPLLLYLWYPASEAKGTPRRFHTAREAKAIRQGLKVAGAPSFLHSNFRLVVSHSHIRAKPAAGAFPLVLFNHGGAMFPAQNLSLIEELASRGMVCASIGRSESLGLAWPDGNESALSSDTVEAMKGSDAFQRAVQAYLTRAHETGSDLRYEALREASDNGLTPLCQLWHADTVRVVEALAQSTLAAQIDFSRRAYAGMSLGGAVSMQAAMLDSQASACVNLDGMNWALPPNGKKVQVPCLQLYSDPNLMLAAAAAKDGKRSDDITLHDGITLYNDRFIKRDEQTSRRLILKGIGHMGLTDMALGVRFGFGGILGLGSAASRSSIEHMNAIVTTFLAERFSNDEDKTSLDAVIAASQADGLVVQLSD